MMIRLSEEQHGKKCKPRNVSKAELLESMQLAGEIIKEKGLAKALKDGDIRLVKEMRVKIEGKEERVEVSAH